MGTTSEPPIVKDNLKDWFKKPERPPTLDPEWNIGKTVDDGPTQNFLRPVYNLLKGICKSYVELEYNMKECYKALNDQLDWNNPEGDRYPFDLSKPLPLDMLILAVKNRLFNLKGEDIVYLSTALRMFTRRIVIQKRVGRSSIVSKSYRKSFQHLKNTETPKLASLT
ncbi:hypothetical protein Tco_1057947 [Tanacetum coccineum]|uniref:Uncharacterized protein n=1 Tax=Tanacetum coccineum TaxID=301880 RepID=A0ABQ5H7I8_9ASTR